MKFFISILISILFLHSSGQPPGIDDSIMNIKGRWTKGQTVIVGEDPALKSNHFPLLYKKLDSIAVLVKQAYPLPKGMEADWHVSVRGNPYFTGGPSPYAYDGMFKYYYYNKAYKKIMLTDETGTWVYVFVNDLNWLVDYTGLSITINGNSKKVWELPSIIGEWKGYAVYDQENFSPTTKVVVITKNGQVPWQPVSQLQYLHALRLKKENEKIKTLADIEAGIVKAKKMIADIRSSKSYSADMKEKMIASAQQAIDKQTRMNEGLVKIACETFERDSKVIDDYIKTHSPESLAQQAVIYEYNDFCFRKKFEDPADKNSRRLIYIDQGYFNKQLPSYVPQFFTMMWRWNNNAPGLFFKKQLEENFPVEKLQAMIPGSRTQPASINDIINNEIKNILAGFRGAGNEQNTWTNVKIKISNYLTQQWKKGTLMGTTEKEAYFVHAGLTSTMTQTDINNGNLIVEVGLALVKPAEFVIIRFVQKL